MAGSAQNILVCVRVRPLESERIGPWRLDGNAVVRTQERAGGHAGGSRATASTFPVDQVFDGDRGTDEVYESIKPVISQVMEGYNGTVFAYGQTGSGKTHTMLGTADEPGIAPLAVRDVFRAIARSQEGRESLVRASAVEVYNEALRDLLDPKSKGLQILEIKKGHPEVAGLREHIVKSSEEVCQLLEEYRRNRSVGGTRMNAESSRSHAVIRLVVESRLRGDAEGAVRVSVLHLVDLAGSENAGKTGATGQRQLEGAAINKSLLALRNVISALSEGKAPASFDFRNSKLTRILQPSLGGNARTALIATVSFAAEHAEETASTLRFACSAKKVRSRAAVNEVADDSALLRRYRAQIAQLEARLAAHGRHSREEVEAQVAALRAELLRKDEHIAGLASQVEALAAGREELEAGKRELEDEADVLHGRLEEVEAALREKEEAGQQEASALGSMYRLYKAEQRLAKRLGEALRREKAAAKQAAQAAARQQAELQARLEEKEREVERLQRRNKDLLEGRYSRVHGPTEREKAAAAKATAKEARAAAKRKAQAAADSGAEQREAAAKAARLANSLKENAGL